MTPGLRQYKSASLRIAEPLGLEEPEMREGIRELIDVQAGNQRKGDASGLLRSVCTEADVDAKVLLIHVSQFADGMGNEQLLKFYGKFNFQVIQTEPVTLMSRQPT